jgi:hypothetical protein
MEDDYPLMTFLMEDDYPLMAADSPLMTRDR